LTESIQKIAQDTGVQVRAIQTSLLQDLNFSQELFLEVNLEAPLGDLVRFIYELKNSSEFIDINRLKLQPRTEGSEFLKSQLIVSTLFLKER